MSVATSKRTIILLSMIREAETSIHRLKHSSAGDAPQILYIYYTISHNTQEGVVAREPRRASQTDETGNCCRRCIYFSLVAALSRTVYEIFLERVRFVCDARRMVNYQFSDIGFDVVFQLFMPIFIGCFDLEEAFQFINQQKTELY